MVSYNLSFSVEFEIMISKFHYMCVAAFAHMSCIYSLSVTVFDRCILPINTLPISNSCSISQPLLSAKSLHSLFSLLPTVSWTIWTAWELRTISQPNKISYELVSRPLVSSRSTSLSRTLTLSKYISRIFRLSIV